MLTSLHQYAWQLAGDCLYAHLYIGGEARVSLGGARVDVRADTRYPWDGNVRMTLAMDRQADFALALRIPFWCDRYTLLVNGAEHPAEVENGYARVRRQWRDGDEVELRLSMEVKRYRAHPSVREDANCVAIMRGPLVYCVEEADNGPDLHLLHIGHVGPEAYRATYEPDTLGGLVSLSSPALRSSAKWECDALYAPVEPAVQEEVTLRWIPYYAWANRSVGEMRVWLPA